MREFNIRVRVFEENEDGHYQRNLVAFPHKSGLEFYDIEINKKELKDHVSFNDPAMSLAHEFGHVVAAEMDMRYSRAMKTPNYGLYFIDKETHLGVENEAWDMARFTMERAYAVGLHDKYFEPIDQKSVTTFTYNTESK